MVMQGVNHGQMSSWCRFHDGLSTGVKGHWLEHGSQLLLKLTKGFGETWCETMNTMIVHALETSVRVLIQSHRQLGYTMSGNSRDKRIISDLLKRETVCAIADQDCYPNNMYDFRIRNFTVIFGLDDDSIYYVPIAQMQAMQLSFAMIIHPRLGYTASGKVLGVDIIKLILSNVFEELF